MKKLYLLLALSILLAIMSMPNIVLSSESPKCPVYKNPTGDEFPIMAWFSFNTKDRITKERFKEMRDAGFNIYMSQLSDTNLVRQSVKAADGTGVRVFINCPEIHNFKKILDVIDNFRNDTSVMGYYLIDEPSADQFNEFRKYRDAIYACDTTRLLFVNLLPHISPNRLKAATYPDYINKYFHIMDLPMLSYDNYPIVTKEGKTEVSETFYLNLEEVRAECRKQGRPFWAFCLSTGHYSYPVPTESHLRFEAFSALGYGAQGIEYFTYTHPDFSRSKFTTPPIDSLGNKTKVWYRVRDVNREIQGLRKVFLGCDVKGVWHTGKKIPEGTVRLTRPANFVKEVSSSGMGVMVSEISNKGNGYILILNRDVVKKQSVTLKYDGKLYQVFPNKENRAFSKRKITLQPGGYIILTE